MSEHKKSASREWTAIQAYTLAIVCLLAGIAGGWLFRGSQPAAVAASETPAAAPSSVNRNVQPTPEQMKKMADTQAADLIERLKTEPNNPGLLVQVGNMYYDVQQYPTAIDYYQRALTVHPEDVAVRTDMATAIWYLGDADKAIAEFNKALSYQPTQPNTLFNLGIVKWQGKMDIAGAVAAWQKLLDTNPTYENRGKVLDLIAQAKKHEGVKPGTQANALPE